MPRKREGEGDCRVEVGAADVADGVDPEHDHQAEADCYADVSELVCLRVDHDSAAAGEDECEGADQLGNQGASEGRLH
jgi:hypothetical protein